MTHDSQLLRLEGNNGADMTDLLQAPGTPRGVGPMNAAVQSPVARVRSIMHGRWKYAIPLAIACAAAGGFLGFKSKVPKYRSTAEILFSSVKPTADQGVVQVTAFQDYVQAQCIIMHSNRELNLALQEPVWQQTDRGFSDEVISDFGKKLTVEHLGGHVTIEYIDEDKDVAQAAVRATVTAYKKLYMETDPDMTQVVLKLLDTDRLGIQNQLASLSDQAKRVCGDVYTSETLQNYYKSKMDELIKTETQMVSTRMEVVAVRDRLIKAGVHIPKELLLDEPGDAGAAEPATAPATTLPAAVATAAPAASNPKPVLPSPQLIAKNDLYMQQLLGQQRSAVANLQELQGRLAPSNPQVTEAQRILARIQLQIDNYVKEWTANYALASENSGADPRLVELDNLLQTFQQLKNWYGQTQIRAQDLGGKVTQLQKIQEQQDELKKKDAQLTARIENLNNAYALANRANFLSDGDKDYLPYEDKRKTMAAAGGGLGGLVGFGFIFLLGFLDKRVKTIADAKYTFRRSRRVLGILPTLPDNLGDPRQAAFAAHCVHHVRNLLQLSMSPDRGAVLAVTSASPGEGKTSLSLSLGLSFAAANSRTLLIDCDVVGGGLTARVNTIIRRKMGDVLKRQGRLTEQQLALALALANQNNIRLGEAIVQLGYLTATDIDEALAAQKESLIGLLDVLDGEPLNSCIANAGSPNLFILPRGMAVASNSGQVSAKAIRRIIAEARAQYDVVLIDTGPVLGSLEASIVASEADGVVLAVSRGQQKTLAERAMELLDSIGANTAGIVFNRAQTDDMDTIQYSSSIPASALQSVPQQTAGGSGTSRMGPIAFAVASATNQSTGRKGASGADAGAAPGTGAPKDHPPA